MPDTFELQELNRMVASLRGPVADPATFLLLDKSKIALLKVRQLEMAIREMETDIELLRLTRELLIEEYKIH